MCVGIPPVCLQNVFLSVYQVLLGIIFFCDLCNPFSLLFEFEFKMKQCQSSCSNCKRRRTRQKTPRLIVHTSISFQQCLVHCCDWRKAGALSVYWAAGSEHAELRGHRTGAERSRPLCLDILLGEQRFLCPAQD